MNAGTKAFRAPGSALALTLALLSCFDSDSAPLAPLEPDPGPLRIILEDAPAARVGLVIELTGEASDFTAEPPYRLWVHSADGRHRILVYGIEGTGTLLRFTAPDRNAPYEVRVTEAAAGAAHGYQPLSPTDFDVHARP